jgi:hypothetical protein
VRRERRERRYENGGKGAKEGVELKTSCRRSFVSKRYRLVTKNFRHLADILDPILLRTSGLPDFQFFKYIWSVFIGEESKSWVKKSGKEWDPIFCKDRKFSRKIQVLHRLSCTSFL